MSTEALLLLVVVGGRSVDSLDPGDWALNLARVQYVFAAHLESIHLLLGGTMTVPVYELSNLGCVALSGAEIV